MKKILNNINFKLGLTIFSIIASCILFFFLIFEIDAVLSGVFWFINILKPFIVGFIFAYLLNPIVKFFQNRVFKKLFAKTKLVKDKKNKFSRFFAILTTYLLAIIFIVVFFSIIIPELLYSLEILIRNIPAYLEQIKYYLLQLLKNHHDIEKIVLDNYDEINVYLLSLINNTFLPKVEHWVVIFSNGVFAAFKALFTVIIGFIVSIYYLYDKEVFKGQIKKILYSIFDVKKTNNIIDYARHADQVFGGFLMVKLMLSILLSIVTLLFLSIFSFPYKVLIAVIVGVTNVIPYFGPFIGGIPCALIILLQVPSKFWLIVIYLIGIQQLEGNILTPKITGMKTGIKSFWVLFAIIFFGGAFGLPGMIIGVPIFALIYTYVKSKINTSLINKDLPTDTEIYSKMDRVNSSNKKVINKTK